MAREELATSGGDASAARSKADVDARVRGTVAPTPLLIAASVFGAALLLWALASFTIPATVALGDRFEVLSHASVVRVYLLWPLLVTLLALGWLLARTRRHQLRRAILLTVLTVGNSILIAVLVLDRKDFTTELSSLTWFTSVVLLAASAASLANMWLARRSGEPSGWPLLWGVLAFGFAVAAADEALALHESAGTVIDLVLGRPEATDASPTGVAQDAITIVYATGALVVGVVLVVVRRRGWIDPGRIFHLVGVAGILIYAVAVSLDNVDKLLAASATSVDLVYLANSIEEVLEFTAANLFLAAPLIALAERRSGTAASVAAGSRTIGGRAGIAGVAALIVAALVGAAAVPVTVPVQTSIIHETSAYDVGEIRTATGAAINPDGFRYVDGALYMTDDIDATLLVLKEGRVERLAGREHGLVRPESVAVTGDGTAFVTDDIANELYAVPVAGGPRRVAGPEDGLLGPRGLTVDREGDLIIGDRLGVAIVRYDGTKLTRVAGALEGISEPEELTVDDEGRIYVAEEGVGQVRRIDRTGMVTTFVDKSSGIVSPEGIVWSDGHLYVADAKVGAIFRFDAAGKGAPVVRFTPRYERIEGLAVGEDGVLYAGIRRDQPLNGMVLELRPRETPG